MKPLFSLDDARRNATSTPTRSANPANTRSATLRSAFMAILIAASFPLQAAASPYLSELRLDWQRGTMTAEVEMDLVASDIRLPSGRSEAEKAMTRIAPDLVRDSVLSIVLDSYRTVDDSLDDGSVDPEALRDFIESGKRLATAMSSDMTRIRASFQWNLAELASLYVRHSIPIALPEADRFVPTRAYTGIIVYVQGEYAVRGEHRPGRLAPSLFPRIYDDEMNPILSRNHVSPEALRTDGIAAFARGLDDPVIELRAGNDPLRIMAYQIFGTLRTDTIITRNDAQKILGDPANRELIRNGRIVFVLDL
ncbi:MAG: hypothetical protein AB7T74_13095 [Clostridia bacterium]